MSIASKDSPPFGPVKRSVEIVAVVSSHNRPDGVMTVAVSVAVSVVVSVVVSVAVSVVVVEESATPEDEEEQMGQHFVSHPDNNKDNAMGAKKRSEYRQFFILFKPNVLTPEI